jgi:hypothetical protein
MDFQINLQTKGEIMTQKLITAVPGFATDYLGNDFKVGDLVIWPNRKGSSMWMNKGHVTAIGMKKAPGHEAYVMVPVLQIERVTSNWDGSQIGKRNVEVVCLDRVVALGRTSNFKPKREKPGMCTTWLDRVMAWLRK